MRLLILFFLFAFSGFAAMAQKTTAAEAVVTKKISKPQIVEAACGGCMFHMKGKGCNLAVRIDGKEYFVDGVSMDDLGDAHSDDGMCNAVRKAEVTGSVVNDRFVSTSFKLLPEEKKKP